MSTFPQKKMKYSQSKKRYYGKSNKEQFLAPGMRGFLATCNFREKDCVREAYNILNHYADELIGPEEKNVAGTNVAVQHTVETTSDDIADELEREVDLVNAKQKQGTYRRFKSVQTGADNCVFIRATISDPVELASHIVNDIRSKGVQRTRFLLRLVPIEAVCRIEHINSTAGQLFDKHFLKQGSTYSIIFNRRFNNDVVRDNVIAELANLVQSKNVENRVNLKNPEKSVVVEIIKGVCLISVITGYIQNKKYNLVELANANKDVEKGEDPEVLATDGNCARVDEKETDKQQNHNMENEPLT